MKNEDKEDCSINRVTITAMKVGGWVFALGLTWWFVRAIWTVFCSIDFNPILRP